MRIEYLGAVYHITSRKKEKKSIFLDEGDREKILHILKEYHNRHGIPVHANVTYGEIGKYFGGIH